MPHRFRPGTISDPVHRYIAFTGLERELFDHFATQCLRYVSQTGLGHLVYPELRSPRFTHCLGAMHLSSAFLAACLRNSDETVLEELVDGIRQAVEQYFGVPGDRFGPPRPKLSEVDAREIGLQAYRWWRMDLPTSDQLNDKAQAKPNNGGLRRSRSRLSG